MPSKNDLELFRDELRSLADEKNVRMEKDEPFEDIPVPEDTENQSAQTVPDDIASLLGLDNNQDTGLQNEQESSGDNELMDFSGLGGLDDASSMADQSETPEPEGGENQDFDLEHFAELLDNLPLEPDVNVAGQDMQDGTPSPENSSAENAPDIGQSGDVPGFDSPAFDNMNFDENDFSVPASENSGGISDLDSENISGTGNVDSDTAPGLDNDFGEMPDFLPPEKENALEPATPAMDSEVKNESDALVSGSEQPSGESADFEDFGFPEDLLSGFGEEMEKTASMVSPGDFDNGVPDESPDMGNSADSVSAAEDGADFDLDSFSMPEFDNSFQDISSDSGSDSPAGGEAAVTASAPDNMAGNQSSVPADEKAESPVPAEDSFGLDDSILSDLDSFMDSGSSAGPDSAGLNDFDLGDAVSGSSGAGGETVTDSSGISSDDFGDLGDLSTGNTVSNDFDAGNTGFDAADFNTGDSVLSGAGFDGSADGGGGLPDLDSMNLGDDFSSGNFEIPDFQTTPEFSDIDSGSMNGSPSSTEMNLSVPEESLGDFNDFSSGESNIPSDSGFSADNQGSFSLENDGIQDNFNLQDFSQNTDSFGEDFSFGGIPGLSDIPGHPVQNLVSGGKNAVRFSISEADFDKFIQNLNLYPLNLRVAIEDLILNAVVPESQIQEVVNLVVGHAPAKQVANTTGKILDRSIEVPKFFEKRRGADRDEEKSSLGYVLRYRILPVACLVLIGIVLLGCVFYLGREFIYNPIKAHSLYAKGYDCLEDNRYTLSQNYFNEGARYRESKKWYYKYARGYREKKQYQLASSMYERMIYRYPKDKNPPLEYAYMECYELLNYEKAEEIVKRKVLDVFVNDKDGKLLLGDIYMEWGGVDPQKYDLAGSVYQELIDTEGRKDLYLGRLLRYNIRTDQLAEVLPLKDYFMQKKTRLDSETLVELSGYLLEKRYAPLGGDDDYLRPMITDVRTLLEKSLARAGDVPETHYNFGKYFVYNDNYSQAIPSLKEAVRLFDEADKMNPGRIIRNVDACRLLGECYASGGEYLLAGEVYSKGITMYQNAVNARTINPDVTGGRLYADIGDMEYFLSGNYNQALESYQNAVENYNDTDSIRYKMGCINYSFENYEEALNNFSRAYGKNPDDKNLMFAMGNAFFLRGDYGAAQGYYTRLMERLETLRFQYGVVLPQVREDHSEFVKMYMETANNLGVTLYYLAGIGGDSEKNVRGIASLTESLRAYDALTRNPDTMIRLSGTNLAEMNLKYMNFPDSTFKPGIYGEIALTLENETPLSSPE